MCWKALTKKKIAGSRREFRINLTIFSENQDDFSLCWSCAEGSASRRSTLFRNCQTNTENCYMVPNKLTPNISAHRVQSVNRKISHLEKKYQNRWGIDRENRCVVIMLLSLYYTHKIRFQNISLYKPEQSLSLSQYEGKRCYGVP